MTDHLLQWLAGCILWWPTAWLTDWLSCWLLGPLLMLLSYWLRCGPYNRMYSIRLQCNAGTIYSLFVLYCKSLNQRYTTGRKLKEDKKPLPLISFVLLFTLTELDKGIPRELVVKAQNRFTICKCLQIWIYIQSKLVLTVSSLFVDLLRPMLLTSYYSVNGI